MAAVIGKRQESRIHPLLIFRDITKATQYLSACISMPLSRSSLSNNSAIPQAYCHHFLGSCALVVVVRTLLSVIFLSEDGHLFGYAILQAPLAFKSFSGYLDTYVALVSACSPPCNTSKQSRIVVFPSRRFEAHGCIFQQFIRAPVVINAPEW